MRRAINVVLLIVVLVSSVAAFGPWGMFVTLAAVGLLAAVTVRQPSGMTLLGHWFHALRTDRGTRITSVVIFVIVFVLLAILILPAVQTVREYSRRVACANNMKQLGLVLHNYHNAHGCFPPAYVVDDQGKPAHSWRTLILRYMDRRDIHESYNFNEPWDGPSNQRLGETELSDFRCSGDAGNDGTRTSYMAITGSGTVWPGERGRRLEEITDGLANTILLVEMADSGIRWMEPRDVTIHEALGPPGGEARVPTSTHWSKGTYWLRSLPQAGWVLFADGSVWSLPQLLSRDDLASLLSVDGGEKVDRASLLADNRSLVERLRWDHCIGLPVFLVALAWLWVRFAAGTPKASLLHTNR